MKEPLHQQKCQKGKVTTQTTPPKSSIKQQLRTDLGRSVGVTTATQLVWLTWFTGPPSHSPQQPCNQKNTQELLPSQKLKSKILIFSFRSRGNLFCKGTLWFEERVLWNAVLTIWRYLQMNWRYLQMIWRYLLFIWRYLQIFEDIFK